MKDEHLSSEPETIKRYEQREKSLADDRNRIDGAKEEAREEKTIKIAKRLLDIGITLSEIAKTLLIQKQNLKNYLRTIN